MPKAQYHTPPSLMARYAGALHLLIHGTVQSFGSTGTNPDDDLIGLLETTADTMCDWAENLTAGEFRDFRAEVIHRLDQVTPNPEPGPGDAAHEASRSADFAELRRLLDQYAPPSAIVALARDSDTDEVREIALAIQKAQTQG